MPEFAMSQISPSERFIEYCTGSKPNLWLHFCNSSRSGRRPDIFQQTNLVLWQKFDSFDGINFAGGLAELRSFRAESSTRKAPAALLFSDEVLTQLTQTASDADDVSDLRRKAIEHCLEKLSDDDRKLIERCYTIGRTIKSVAEQLKRSSRSVSNSLRRIRRALSECINRQMAPEGRQ